MTPRTVSAVERFLLSLTVTAPQHETTRQGEERTERRQAPGEHLPTGVGLASGSGHGQHIRHCGLNAQDLHCSGAR